MRDHGCAVGRSRIRLALGIRGIRIHTELTENSLIDFGEKFDLLRTLNRKPLNPKPVHVFFWGGRSRLLEPEFGPEV